MPRQGREGGRRGLKAVCGHIEKYITTKVTEKMRLQVLFDTFLDKGFYRFAGVIDEFKEPDW